MSGMYIFMQPSLFIRDPEILKLVMIKDAEYFINRFNWIKNTDPLLSKGLNLLQGAKKKDGGFTKSFNLFIKNILFCLFVQMKNGKL